MVLQRHYVNDRMCNPIFNRKNSIIFIGLNNIQNYFKNGLKTTEACIIINIIRALFISSI